LCFAEAGDAVGNPENSFSMDAWAECLAVCCLTLAMTQKTNNLEHYVNCLVDDIMKKATKEASGD